MPLVMLLISIVLGIIPLAGIAWILVAGSITTVDGLFMSLILLTLSGVFFLNVVLELRDRGLLAFLQKDKTTPAKEPRRRCQALAESWPPNPVRRAPGRPKSQLKVPQPVSARPRHRMSTRNRLLFFLTAWLIVLMPFLFWWSTWFGRQLSRQADRRISERRQASAPHPARARADWANA